MEEEVSQTTFELGQRDVPAYIAYGAGVAMSLAIQRAVGPPRYSSLQLEKSREVFRRAYDHWLDPANPKGIVMVVTDTNREISARLAKLYERPRTLKSVSTSGTPATGICTIETVITIAGDVANGFSVGHTESSKECSAPVVPCKSWSCFVGLGDELSTLAVGLTIGSKP